MDKNNVCEISNYQQGWHFHEETYHCLYCPQIYQEGQIYPHQEKLLTAKKAMQLHLDEVHQGPLTALLDQPRDQTGLSETQQEILTLFAQQLSDPVIAQRLGVSTSTVRNHRFKLKEKERQAKLLVSIMSLLNQTDLPLPHYGATMIDDRYAITPAEQEKVFATYLDENQFIQQFPSKEKRKLVLLAFFAEKFNPQKNYSESAVNDIIKQHIEDYVTVRRYLIEYGFLKRTKDGQTYWRNVKK